MPAKRKRLTAVDIAKDVLALLDKKKIKANQGGYLDLGDQNWKKFAGCSLQEAIQSQGFKPCYVCGIGAMFMAYVDKKNKVRIPEEQDAWGGYAKLDDRQEMVEALYPYISMRQLDLIEVAFEVDGADTSGGLNDENYAVIKAWSRQYKTPTAKLVAICKNMIANKGIFKPSVTMAVDFR